ncbi:hypothetical protein BGX38DRAFT_673243 [Terfezia claveryi]|nr:hypothetical protein BGX38DRAFT_673243 [Terfezia claveryi]
MWGGIHMGSRRAAAYEVPGNPRQTTNQELRPHTKQPKLGLSKLKNRTLPPPTLIWVFPNRQFHPPSNHPHRFLTLIRPLPPPLHSPLFKLYKPLQYPFPAVLFEINRCPSITDGSRFLVLIIFHLSYSRILIVALKPDLTQKNLGQNLHIPLQPNFDQVDCYI